MELTRPEREHTIMRVALILGVPNYRKRLRQRIADGIVIETKHGPGRSAARTFRAVKRRAPAARAGRRPAFTIPPLGS